MVEDYLTIETRFLVPLVLAVAVLVYRRDESEEIRFLWKDRSANGTSASVGLAGRIMRSNRRSWLGRMRPDRGGAAELPIYAQGWICLVGSSPS